MWKKNLGMCVATPQETYSRPHKRTQDRFCKLKRSSKNIFHKNREISILMMKKKQQGYHFLRKPQKEPNKGRQKTNEKRKTHIGMNKSASLTPVQGPSTVVCTIVT
jgi:hypothetical protein